MIRATQFRGVRSGSCIACLLYALMVALCARAQQLDPPQPETTAGNYNIRQSVELGYRITGQSGNRDVFDTIVDEHTGLRLVDQSLEVHSLNNAGVLFDALSLSSFGLGGEPSSVIRLRASRNKLYNFNANFRRDHNFWDYNLLANPLNPSSSVPFVPVLNSPHRFEVVRRMSDYNLTLLPQSRVRLRLGYARNFSQGPSFTSFHADDIGGAETLLFQPWRQTEDSYQLGLDARVLPRTSISYDQFFQYTRGDNSELDRNFNFQLSNGAPVDLGLVFNTQLFIPCDSLSINRATAPPTAAATCNGFLAYSRFAPLRSSSPTEQLGFQSNYFKRLELSGRAMYSTSTGKAPTIDELFDGFLAASRLRQSDFTGAARSRRVTVAGDFGLTWNLTDRLHLTDSFRFHDLRVPGAGNSLQNSFFATSLLAAPNVFNPTLCPPPFSAAACPQHSFGSGPDVATHASFTFIGQETKSNLVQLEYDFTRRLRMRLGYRYRNRLITQRDLILDNLIFFPPRANRDVCLKLPLQPDGTCVANLQSAITGNTEINEHSLVVGANSRFFKGDIIRLNGDVELFWADNFFTRVNPRQSQHYRARASYQPAPWANLSLALNILDRSNHSAGIGFSGRDRNFSFSTLLAKNDWLGLDLSYDFTSVFSRANICFISTTAAATTPLCDSDPVLLQTVSFYNTRTHFGRAALMWKPAPRLTAHLGASVTSAGGDTLFLNQLMPTGPLRSLYLWPSADLAVELRKDLEWRLAWGDYDYNEHSAAGPTLPRDFRAQTGTIALRYWF